MNCHAKKILSFKKKDNKTMNKKFISLLLIACFSTTTFAESSVNTQLSNDVFTVEKLNDLNQLHDVVVSPNGKQLLYGLKKGTLSSDNHLYLKDLASGKTKQITSNEKAEGNVIWAKDSQSIYFLSSRNGSSQIWQLALTGGEAQQITDLALPVNGFKVSANGNLFALAITVQPHCVEADNGFSCTLAAMAKDEDKKHNTRVYNNLMVRHWDTWSTDFKEHLFVAKRSKQGLITNAKDLIPHWQSDIAGIDEVAIHPKLTTIVFAAKNSATAAASKNHAWTTNFDLFEVELSNYQLTNITQANQAWDASPVFSKDGRFLAYKAMATAGYESDKFSLRLRDNVTGKVRQVAQRWDRSVNELIFADDNRTLLVTAQDLGQKSIFTVNSEFGDVRAIYHEGSNGSLSSAGDNIYFTRHTLATPKDIFTIKTDGYGVKQLTEVNKKKLANVKFADYQQFSFKGWNNELVYGYWLKPANFEQGKKYPMAFLVHGGPQGSFGNIFHYRWNAQLWAAQGYGVVMIDFHGSTGYGQEFTDAIARDWGGKPLEDLQKGFDFIVKDQPWLDGENACALGASYGGYMMNWIQGNWSDRFNCIVNHAGLFDMPSFYQSTEELWFPEHDLGGSPWGDKEGNANKDYAKFNPSALVNNWRTPMLVIQGELDYRVPYAQSLGAFTALQRNGIASRLVMFKDEDHHIRKPDNLIFWYQQVFDWLATYTKKDNANKINKVEN
jgi:dipeptidyl aminopeptidase/acylaminoacyl peptidase